jgi:hypothetical protein
MTSERSNAYGRVTHALRDVGPTKLLPAERDTVREAADTLLFAETVDAPGAEEAVAAIRSLVDHLETTERWTPERAQRLADDVLACGPVMPVGCP